MRVKVFWFIFLGVPLQYLQSNEKLNYNIIQFRIITFVDKKRGLFDLASLDMGNK